MVEVLTVQEPTVVQNGNVVTTFRVPAISKTIARRRAKGNARLKGLESPEIREVNEVAPGGIPGQTIYEIKVVTRR